MGDVFKIHATSYGAPKNFNQISSPTMLKGLKFLNIKELDVWFSQGIMYVKRQNIKEEKHSRIAIYISMDMKTTADVLRP